MDNEIFVLLPVVVCSHSKSSPVYIHPLASTLQMVSFSSQKPYSMSGAMAREKESADSAEHVLDSLPCLKTHRRV